MHAVCTFGRAGQHAGGLIDRQGKHLCVFDVDGTRESLLQRELPNRPDGRPAPRRRQAATAPGYTGRARADRVMNRMVVQQSHTQEFLGSLPMPGNGHRGPALQWAAQQVAHYADAHRIPRECCVIRGDGEHGLLTQVEQIAQLRVGFLVRCADYQLLQVPEVQAALAAGTTVAMVHDDSGMERHVFDVPQVMWASPKGGSRAVRLVVTRATFPSDKKHRVGHRIGNEVFELFCTDRPATSLHAADVVSLYLHRAQFEAALAQEERELPVGHWASDTLQGQRLWHLVGQWVWNLRLWLGSDIDPSRPPCRRTDFTTEVQALPSLVRVDLVQLRRDAALAQAASAVSSANVAPDAAVVGTASVSADVVQEVSPSRPPTAARVGALRFVRDEAGVVHCPAGHPMQLREVRPRVSGPRERHEVARSLCALCPQRAECRWDHVQGTSAAGRRIDLPPEALVVETDRLVPGSRRASLRVIAVRSPSASGPLPSTLAPSASASVATAAQATEPPGADSSLWWLDAAAAATRRAFRDLLTNQRVDVSVDTPPIAPTPASESTRARRAHRRRSQLEHWQRNADTGRTRCALRHHGVPPSLAIHLRIKVIA